MNHGSFDINKNHRLYFDDAYHAMGPSSFRVEIDSENPS